METIFNKFLEKNSSRTESFDGGSFPTNFKFFGCVCSFRTKKTFLTGMLISVVSSEKLLNCFNVNVFGSHVSSYSSWIHFVFPDTFYVIVSNDIWICIRHTSFQPNNLAWEPINTAMDLYSISSKFIISSICQTEFGPLIEYTRLV